MNLIAVEPQLAVSGELSTFEDRGENNDAVYVLRRFCGACGSPIVSVLTGANGVIAVKAGTLDDKRAVAPTVEAWCEHRQPWVELPGMEVSLDRE